MRGIIAFALLCVAFTISTVMAVILTIDAHAQEPQCKPWPEMQKLLIEKAGMTALGPVGMISDKAMLTLFANYEGENWILIAVSVNGTACVVMEGRHWVPLDLKQVPHPGERSA